MLTAALFLLVEESNKPQLDLNAVLSQRRTSYTIEGARWTIVETYAYQGGSLRDSVTFQRDGRTVRRINEDGELDATSMTVVRIWPSGGLPVFCVQGTAGAGHYEVTQFYCIKAGELVLMHSSDEGERGGPIFRDFDGDGVCEWVFDNFNHYESLHAEHRGEGNPDKFLVYKLNDNGQLRLWRRLAGVCNLRNSELVCHGCSKDASDTNRFLNSERSQDSRGPEMRESAADPRLSGKARASTE